MTLVSTSDSFRVAGVLGPPPSFSTPTPTEKGFTKQPTILKTKGLLSDPGRHSRDKRLLWRLRSVDAPDGRVGFTDLEGRGERHEKGFPSENYGREPAQDRLDFRSGIEPDTRSKFWVLLFQSMVPGLPKRVTTRPTSLLKSPLSVRTSRKTDDEGLSIPRSY